MNEDFKGLWIPKEIWLDKKLTLQEKVMLSRIYYLDNDNGCFAGNQYFAEFMGISKTRVSLIVKNLIDKGYIKSTTIYKKGSKEILNRVLNICYIGYTRKVKEGIQEMLNTPIQEKLKDNIEYININNNIKKISAKADIQKGKPFCSNAEIVKNEFEDAESAQNNTLTYKNQIEVQRQRYNAEQLKIIDNFFDILKYTRRSSKLADSVVLKIYTKWNKYEIQKVIYGISVYIDNPKLHDKKENYVEGIIRNSTTEEIHRKLSGGESFGKTNINERGIGQGRFSDTSDENNGISEGARLARIAEQYTVNPEDLECDF